MNVPSSHKIRVADYVAQTLVKNGIRDIFLVTGGGAMHLNDAIGRCKDLNWICCHHEQACAMAAESYARLSGRMAAVNVTTGPGGTNAITGVYGAYVDSIPMIIISGQVKQETLVRSTQLALRQLGDQEVDIISIVKPITKYAEIIWDAKTIRYHLEKAIYLAKSGRPGPCWIDIPINIQSTLIDPEGMNGFDPQENEITKPKTDVKQAALKILEKLKTSKRPVLLVGSGIRLSQSHSEFIKLVDLLKIPVVTAWNSHDAIWNSHQLYIGRPGTIGDRAGNFAVQNSDFLLVLGCRLNVRQISYNWKSFARNAYKVIVDIDEAELKKPTLNPDFPVHADVKDMIRELSNHCTSITRNNEHDLWLEWCQVRKNRYPVVLPQYWQVKDKVNPYCFVDALFKELKEDEVVVTGDGTACVVTFQAANIKQGQRLYTNSGCASMGYDLPAAIGAYFANPSLDRVVCLAGDGSIQMNLQELQTIATHKIPIKLFILNNGGYHSIRQTQQNYFPDNIVGCGTESGLGFPNFEVLAKSYSLSYSRVENHTELRGTISKALATPIAEIIEVILDLEQQFAPKLSSRKLSDGSMISSPLEDLAPFLSREELKENMLIPLESESLK